MKELANALYRQNLSSFVRRAWPEVEAAPLADNWHIDCLCEHLEYVYRKDIKRLIINVPPRTLKTYIANICFSAWILGKSPGASVLGISYAHSLSEDIAYKTRILMNTAWYKDLFPNTIIDPDQSQKKRFKTLSGGGRISTAVHAATTGKGGNYMIVDDPLNPEEAFSDTQREATNRWIDHTIFSRLNNPKEDAIVCIMQRLHTDDTTKQLLDKGDWHTLKLPAETKEKIVIDLGQKRWEYTGLLHEDRLNDKVLEDFKRSMGAYAYSAQYLQEPTPLSGGEFSTNFINWYQSKDFNANNSNIYITVDPANSKKKNSDYTAMCVWAIAPDQNWYVIDAIKEKLDPNERINKLFELHRKWNGKTRKPARVGYEAYGMMSDKHYIEERQRTENYRFPIQEIRSRINKEDRIRRLISPMRDGRIWMPNDIMSQNERNLPINLIDDIIKKEMLLFPYAPHDDFIDAMAMIFEMDIVYPKFGKPVYDYSYDTEPKSVLDL